jgi:hypothetical protein
MASYGYRLLVPAYVSLAQITRNPANPTFPLILSERFRLEILFWVPQDLAHSFADFQGFTGGNWEKPARISR